MELEDWTLEYVKARNAMRRTLKSQSKDGDVLTFVHSHKTHHFLIAPELHVPKAEDWYTVVCLNSKRNVDFLLAHWDDLCQDRLSILFVNPAQNQSWQVTPKMHSLIADPDTLEQGVRTMASEVPTA